VVDNDSHATSNPAIYNVKRGKTGLKLRVSLIHVMIISIMSVSKLLSLAEPDLQILQNAH